MVLHAQLLSHNHTTTAFRCCHDWSKMLATWQLPFFDVLAGCSSQIEDSCMSLCKVVRRRGVSPNPTTSVRRAQTCLQIHRLAADAALLHSFYARFCIAQVTSPVSRGWACQPRRLLAAHCHAHRCTVANSYEQGPGVRAQTGQSWSVS